MEGWCVGTKVETLDRPPPNPEENTILPSPTQKKICWIGPKKNPITNAEKGRADKRFKIATWGGTESCEQEQLCLNHPPKRGIVQKREREEREKRDLWKNAVFYF